MSDFLADRIMALANQETELRNHIAALKALFREIASQKTTAELSEEETDSADFETAYDVLIHKARDAIKELDK